MTMVHYAGDRPFALTQYGIRLLPGMADFELDAAILAGVPKDFPLAAVGPMDAPAEPVPDLAPPPTTAEGAPPRVGP